MQILTTTRFHLGVKQTGSHFSTFPRHFGDIVVTLFSNVSHWSPRQWFSGSIPCFWICLCQSFVTVPLLSTLSFVGCHTASWWGSYRTNVWNWNTLTLFRWLEILLMKCSSLLIVNIRAGLLATADAMHSDRSIYGILCEARITG